MHGLTLRFRKKKQLAGKKRRAKMMSATTPPLMRENHLLPLGFVQRGGEVRVSAVPGQESAADKSPNPGFTGNSHMEGCSRAMGPAAAVCMYM